MDIFEFAIKMEMDGQHYYENLAAQSRDASIKNVMKMLAEDEVKHRQAIEKIRLSTCGMAETKILERARNVRWPGRSSGSCLSGWRKRNRNIITSCRGLWTLSAGPRTGWRMLSITRLEITKPIEQNLRTYQMRAVLREREDTL